MSYQGHRRCSPPAASSAARALTVPPCYAVFRASSTRRAPLFTRTGAGGAGKTRLALAVADALQSDFVDGVIVVSLAPVRGPEGVASAIGEAFDFLDTEADPTGARSIVERLAAALQYRQVLL